MNTFEVVDDSNTPVPAGEVGRIRQKAPWIPSGFYNNVEDLADKIKFYKDNEKSRINIARNGKKKYFKLFNEQRITKYIIDKSFGKKTNLI